jgi:hypothetical protein
MTELTFNEPLSPNAELLDIFGNGAQITPLKEGGGSNNHDTS